MRSLRAGQSGFPEYAGLYRLESVLGAGGMGVVHLATSASGLKLAVKIVHAQHAVDPEFRARFQQEVAAARRVSGAFTAPVVDADPDAERPWMATLFIDAPTLAERVRERVLDPAEVGRLGAGLAEALRDIHRAGVVHRDLKPSNVLMASDGPKVIDFGISRPYDSDLRTETGKLIGTPPFMAPEQFQRPRDVGPAADVFAMGALLVHAATGHGPFDSESAYIVAYQVVHNEPDLTGVPSELAPLIARCLAKDPAARPTADELIGELRSVAYPTNEDTRTFIPRPRLAASAPGADPQTHRRDGLGPVRPRLPAEPAAGPPTHRRDSLPAGGAAEPRAGRRRTRWRVAAALGTGLLVTGGAVGGYAQLRDTPPATAADHLAGTAREPGPARITPWATTPGAPGAAARIPACAWLSDALYCSAPGLAAVRLNPATGAVVWSAAGVTGAGDPAPFLGGGSVLAYLAGAHVLQALDPATGAQRWKADVPLGADVVPAGALVLVAADGQVTARDAATGSVRWAKRPAGVGAQLVPAADGSEVYAVTPAGDGTSTQVLALAAADGTTRWQHRSAGLLEPVGVAAGALHLLAGDGMVTDAVVRMDLRSRTERRTLLPTSLLQAQGGVGADGTVYAFASGGALVAVGAERELWRLETAASQGSRPVAADGRVHLMAADGRLLAVDAGRGRLVGQTAPRMATGAHTFTPSRPSPVVADGRVFGSAPDGTVFAVDPGGWR
ncbi:PQQ-binding-like beta-propeller repeat protein [Streptomyces sp. G-G2]|uniref:serine/threonine-protein kinase n=1 Tax=Streptomyces sp. G-G2 TaxID=3046201 RepID=UPI0024BAE8DF|nr:PQQ-binding-like beta-propeller repeat protein [Streptomyces sp. G-G2]MDJ0384899.1 PQQ-binding-like beta-propeller repeat protein [Streptomyces sp. G-G2]